MAACVSKVRGTSDGSIIHKVYPVIKFFPRTARSILPPSTSSMANEVSAPTKVLNAILELSKGGSR